MPKSGNATTSSPSGANPLSGDISKDLSPMTPAFTLSGDIEKDLSSSTSPAPERPAKPGFFSAGGVVNLPDEPNAPPYKQPSGREILGDLVPAVAGLIPGGRTVTRGLRTLGANVLGRGAVEAGAEALSPTGQGPLSAGVSGAAKGVLPGLAQAGVGALFGPSKDTIQVEKAAQALKKAVSPEVAALIKPNEPASLMSRRIVQKMGRVAGAALDKMEAEVEKALGPKWQLVGGTPGPTTGLFTASGRPSAQPSGQTFAEVRTEIKRLREIASYDRQTSAATAQAAKKDAARLEQTLLSQMPPEVAAKYRTALEAHTKDMDAVRWVKGLQQENKIRGGVNPQDRPELAAADRAVPKGSKGKAAIHGVLGAAEAATGRGLGAGYHLGRAADQMRAGGPLRPAQKVSQTLPAITRGLVGTGTAAGQTVVTE
jgi:hypothetical protein